MSTGTIIMIVCAVLYGLIVILFKDETHVIKEDDPMWWDNPDNDPTLGFDGSLGACGLCADDFDTDPPK